MIVEKPYFLRNKDWYTHDKEKFRYQLTKKAPDKAKKSYEEFYKLLDELTNS